MAIHTEYSLRHKVEFRPKELVRASKDVHFNDIPIKLWDKLVPLVRHGIARKNEELNGTLAVSECVCTLKTAAHII